jgi:hypothetical protein
MINRLKYSFVFAVVVCITASAQEKTGDVVLDAMQDELRRNMSELKIPDLSAPFYMMYGLQDQKTYVVAATLGSISEYEEVPVRFRTNTRILVGSYEFNDESLDDNHFSNPTAHEIELPVDDDYYGIRRSFWSSTDKVYRDAARHFQKHQQTLKESGKDLSVIPHRTFAKSEPVKLLVDQSSFKWDKERYTALARNLSAKFIGHSQIQNSAVIVRFIEGKRYLVTSEGTVARVPFSLAAVVVFAQSRNDEGEFFNDQLGYEAAKPDGLPEETVFSLQVDQMISRLLSAEKEKKLEEEYTGPVLVMGSAVADIFGGIYFRGKDNVMASDNIPRLKGYQYDQSGSTETRIGKSLTHESITVKAKPTLKKFGDTDLLGSYLIDGEAMVPADEVTIIENGVLKTMLDNRTLTNNSKHVLAQGFEGGPGVVEVTSSFKNTDKELKDKLIQKAKSAGLDFAFIVRNSGGKGPAGMEIFRVAVKDGREELIRNARFERPSPKELRKLIGASATYRAFNVMSQMNDGGSPDLTSYIVPEAILLEEGEVKPFSPPTFKEEKFVTNPLAN